MEDTTRVLQLRREIHRLRNSPSLRLGAHLTSAIRRPWRAPFLIVTLPLMMLKIGFELLGWVPQPSSLQTNANGRPIVKGNCVVMFPTNGVGFGHFTRMLALAKRMKKQDTNLEIIFFTTMPTLHLLKPYGIPAHHISGPKYFKGIDSEEWNMLLEEELNLCFEIHKPSMFIFDGAFPYRGMLRSIEGRSSLKKLWMRRGTFKKGSSVPVDSIRHFDTIIRPGDIEEPDYIVEESVENTMTSQPIVMLEDKDLLSKKMARSRLGIPQNSVVVYVQLGAGQINDISSEIRMTLDELLKYENLHVVLGESMIGSRIDVELPNVHIIRDYPNSQYFNGFDAVIQAGGYNSFHETRVFGLPALFYPNMETGMDDQLTRCNTAVTEGWGLVLRTRKKESIRKAINELLTRNWKFEHALPENGADMLSAQLLQILGAGK